MLFVVHFCPIQRASLAMNVRIHDDNSKPATEGARRVIANRRELQHKR